MAEELTPSTPAVEQAVEESTGQPTGGEQKERQPKQPKVNLDDIPQFRDWKSKSDQQIAQANQRAQQAEVRMQQIEQQMHELAIRDLPDEDKRLAVLQRQAQAAEQRAAAAEQYAQQLVAQQQIDQNLMRISAKTGLPLDEARRLFFEERKSPDDIWEIAADRYADQRRKRKTDDDDDDDEGTIRAKANRTDSGSGKSNSGDTIEQRIAKAKASGDPVQLAKLLLEHRSKQ
jgi:hypothetical protein